MPLCLMLSCLCKSTASYLKALAVSQILCANDSEGDLVTGTGSHSTLPLANSSPGFLFSFSTTTLVRDMELSWAKCRKLIEDA